MLPEGVRAARARRHEATGGARDNRGPMHLIVPFAAPLPDAGRAAARSLQRPVLAALREHLPETGRDEGDEWSLSPPHERAWARAAGWVGPDGALPFAAHEAARCGIDTGDLAWALLTPVHWHLGTEQVSLVDPAALALDESTSRALCEAVRPLFTGDGWLLAWARPDAWFAAHESLATLPTASLDRVIGRNVDAWLGSDAAARRLRRLQAEVQMLLHGHPLNAEREQRGLLPVNSVWVSGCGPRQPVHDAAGVVVDAGLRAPALAGDWAAWCKAWDVLEAGALSRLLARVQRGEPATLTLCGERGSVTLGGTPATAWQRWWQRWGRSPMADWLEAL
jgi:hypothetical protein